MVEMAARDDDADRSVVKQVDQRADGWLAHHAALEGEQVEHAVRRPWHVEAVTGAEIRRYVVGMSARVPSPRWKRGRMPLAGATTSRT